MINLSLMTRHLMTQITKVTPNIVGKEISTDCNQYSNWGAMFDSFDKIL
jgi:hypothetical protein